MWILTEERQSNEQKDTVILLRGQVHEREHYLYLNIDTSLYVGRGGCEFHVSTRNCSYGEKLAKYLQSVRKCKMHILKLQACKVRV